MSSFTLHIMPSRKVFRIGTVRYNWPMSVHASQAFNIAHCTDSEDLLLFHLRNGAFRLGLSRHFAANNS